MSRALAALQDLCATVGTSTDLQLTNDDGSKEYTSIVCHYQVSILTSTDLQLTNDDGWYEDTSICGHIKFLMAIFMRVTTSNVSKPHIPPLLKQDLPENICPYFRLWHLH